MVKDKGFEEKSSQEKEGLYVALGSTGVPGAINFFAQVLQQKSGLFNKQKVIADKTLAVVGLSGACTIQTAKFLQEVADDKTQPAEVTHVAKIHLSRVRKQLFGSADKEA